MDSTKSSRRGRARTILSLLFLGVGVAMFALGTHLSTASPADLGDFFARGLENGSIWLCLGGGFIASFGAVAFMNPRLGSLSGGDGSTP